MGYRFRRLLLAFAVALALPGIALADETGAAEGAGPVAAIGAAGEMASEKGSDERAESVQDDAYLYYYEDGQGNLTPLDVEPPEVETLGAPANVEGAGAGYPVTYLRLDVTYHQDEARRCFDLVNRFRSNSSANWCWDEDNPGKRLPGRYRAPAKWDRELELDCIQRATECAVIFGHVSPAQGYGYLLAPQLQGGSENLACTGGRAEDAFNSWKEEGARSAAGQQHRMAMLYEASSGPDVYMGIACVEGPSGGYYWVLHVTGTLYDEVRWTGDSTGIMRGSREPIQQFTNWTGTETAEVPVLDSALDADATSSSAFSCSPDFILLNGRGSSAELPQVFGSEMYFTLTNYRTWETMYGLDAEVLAGWTVEDEGVAAIEGDRVVAVASSGVTYLRGSAFGKTFRITIAVGRGFDSAVKSYKGTPFIDVGSRTAHRADILWLYFSGISTGWNTKAGRQYRPLNNVARADMAAFLYRLEFGLDSQYEPEQEDIEYFCDVTWSTPHCREIWWLAHEGISRGWTEADGTHTFRPLANVARCDMAAFLYRLAGEPEFSAKDADVRYFSDADAETPHAMEVWWLASTGVSAGWTVGSRHEFRPFANVARADMAAFLHRMYSNGLVPEYL